MERSAQRAYFRFYAELNDHLSAAQQFKMLEKSFYVSSTVIDMIEGFGVPHAEVELIVANGESVGPHYLVRGEDRISVYPMFESLDISPELRVRQEPLREPKFVLDVHLGKLAAYLRMLGFDTLYRSCYTDPELVKIASAERRILLTRDRGLLKHGAVTHGYWLRNTDSREQAAEVVRRFDLASKVRPFTRCMACNGTLKTAPKEEILALVPEGVAKQHDEFRRCSECGRVYWEGSHHQRMLRLIEQMAA